MGIITVSENFKALQGITSDRVVTAIPFGGRYRIIDFILSNMVNSGVQNVGIFIGDKSRSLLDHLRSGKDWDLSKKRNGLFILPIDCSSCHGIYMGNLEYFHKHQSYFSGSTENYVLIANSNTIFNTNFKDVFRFHLENDADVTVVYTEHPQIDSANNTIIETDDNNKVTDITVKPSKHSGNQKISMEIYLMKRELLMDITETCISKGQSDLTKNGIIKNINKFNIYAYHYPGYFGRVTSLSSYYKHNLDLLDPEIWTELFFKSGPVYTKVKNEPPTKYTHKSKVVNSLIASGCIIEGKVENSILFRGAVVLDGATVKNCILLPRSEVKEKAYIQNLILDKKACISEEKVFIGDGKHPLYIGKKNIL